MMTRSTYKRRREYRDSIVAATQAVTEAMASMGDAEGVMAAQAFLTSWHPDPRYRRFMRLDTQPDAFFAAWQADSTHRRLHRNFREEHVAIYDGEEDLAINIRAEMEKIALLNAKMDADDEADDEEFPINNV